MNAETSPTYPYKIGGNLPPDSPSYVVRQADKDLYQGLKNGEFCYVLNSRQMGKSSLLVQTMQQLQTEKIAACVLINLQEIGSQVNPEKWYYGIANRSLKGLQLHRQLNLAAWWTERKAMSQVQRLDELIDTILLTAIDRNVAILIDEIDAVLGLDFPADDFFAWIRACYNKRANQPKYQRLTFALFGVASPSDLMRDKQRTPFNIGKAIDLAGFSLSETEPLARGLVGKVHQPQVALQAILNWTGGQPFLTQKICALLAQTAVPIPKGQEAIAVDRIVKQSIVRRWREHDHPVHLGTICNRLLYSKQPIALLGLYQKILRRGAIAIDNNSPEQLELCLAGLTFKQGKTLRIYNPIYRYIFNDGWVKEQLAELRPYEEKFNAWLVSEQQDQSQLLYGVELQQGLQWAEQRSLFQQEFQFLEDSRAFDRQAAGVYLYKCHDYEAALEAILDWTGGQQVLNEGLFQMAQQTPSAPKTGQEAEWVEGLVRSQLLADWEVKKTAVAAFLRQIRDRVLNHPQTFNLLQCYQQVLQSSTVNIAPSTESQALLKLGLIIEQDGQFRIANQIYQAVFNLEWLNQIFLRFCPYAEALAAWETSQRQDMSQLLDRSALDPAFEWIACTRRQLNDSEHGFLFASQLLAVRGRLEMAEQKVLRTAQSLVGAFSNPQAIFQHILYWTAGEAFLTQQVSQALFAAKALLGSGEEAIWVEQVVRSRIIEPRLIEVGADPLQAARDRFGSNEQLAFQGLFLYQQVLLQGSIATDGSVAQQDLVRSGLTIVQRGRLVAQNRICKIVFDRQWVQQTLPHLHPYTQSLDAWLASDQLDRSTLLSETMLPLVLQWSADRYLSLPERQFLTASQVMNLPRVQTAAAAVQIDAIQTSLVLFDRVDQPQKAIEAVLSWTEGQPALTLAVFQLLRANTEAIAVGQEASWVEQQVRSQLLQNWETQAAAEHLQYLSRRLFGHPRAFWLLNCYQALLQGGSGNAASPEQATLLELGLVVQYQGNFRVANRIYRTAFALRWVRGMLSRQRPYFRAFSSWCNANGRDTSQLLRGSALEAALTWARDKRPFLVLHEAEFLQVSQVWNLPQLQATTADIQAKIIETAQQLFRKTRNARAAIAALLTWTAPQPILIQAGLKRLLADGSEIPPGQEKAWIEQWVRSQWIDLQTDASVTDHLEEIRDRILNNRRCDPFQLLLCYEHILQTAKSPANRNAEQTELIASGLVVQQNDRFVPANSLYQAAFNRQWVAASLLQLRPYAGKLRAWLASSGKNSASLLSRAEFSASLESLDQSIIGHQEQQFLLASQLHLLEGGSDRLETMQLLETFMAELEQRHQTRNLQRWIQAILHWTTGHPDALSALCPLVLQANFSIPARQVAVAVEQLVRSQLLEDWENQTAAIPFQSLRDRLFRHEQCVDLLQLYQKILQADGTADNNPGILALVELGLIVQQKGQLRAASLLHKHIFSLDWVAQVLLKMPPYARKLVLWLDTQKQDRSQLLRGEELQAALDWVSGKQLSAPANQFLIASQVFNLRGV